jgi:RND superfamily putative drug exporter
MRLALGSRISHACTGRRSKWVVIGLWIVIFVVSAPLASKLTGAQNNDAGSYLPKSAESTKVLDAQKNFADADVLDAVIVYERPSGITPADETAISAQRAAASKVSGIKGTVTQVQKSDDGAAAAFLVPIYAKDSVKFIDTVKSVRAQLHSVDGLSVHLTGPAGVQSDSNDVFSDIDGKLLYATVLVVVLVLLLTYRSPVLWLIPVLGAAAALELAQAVVYGLAKSGMTVNGLSAGILLVLVFGAGTDYALLLVARYREELHNHEDKHEAMAFALHRAGPAIVASSTTVIVSLLCLLVCQMQSTRGLGPVGAVGILCAVAAMTTFLPALLVAVPRKVFWPFVPRFGTPTREESGPWGRVAARVSRRPRPIWVSGVVVLGVLCVGLLTLNAHGLSDKDQFVGKPDSIKGEAVMAAHFGGATAAPAVVIADGGSADAVTAAIAKVPGLQGKPQVTERAVGLVEIDAQLANPADSAAAKHTILALREAVHAVPGANAMVGGATAVNYDSQQASAADTRLVMPIVLAVVLIILVLLLRAIVAPVLLVASVVLSFFAALGASAFAWRHILGFPGADASAPLYLFIFLVALGIDYNIFLMSRVREESLQIPTREAIRKGVAVTGGVITSAGIVLAATFSVLAVLPLVTLVEVGSAVAFGVLLDTFIIRSIVVPAAAHDIGAPIWWPSSLVRGPRVRAPSTEDALAAEP